MVQGICERLVVGQSVEGRDIELFLFGEAATLMGSQCQLNTLFVGAFHGDEGISTELLLQFLKACKLRSPQKSVGLIPALNPDGLALRQRVNARGVDLNRNFPTQDWVSADEGSIYYSGPDAGSEPETQIMLQVLARYQPTKIISVHAPYRVINYDGPARALAESMSHYSGYPVVDSIGYPTPGSFGTYAGVERQMAVITLELPEDEAIYNVWRDNEEALWEAIHF